MSFLAQAESDVVAAAFDQAVRRHRNSGGGLFSRRLRLAGAVSGKELAITATPWELHPFSMEITGQIRELPGGSEIDANVAVPISTGMGVIFVVFAVLIVVFSGLSLPIGVLVATGVWLPLWLAAARMNQRQLMSRSKEVEGMLRQIAAEASSPSQVTFTSAE